MSRREYAREYYRRHRERRRAQARRYAEKRRRARGILPLDRRERWVKRNCRALGIPYVPVDNRETC